MPVAEDSDRRLLARIDRHDAACDTAEAEIVATFLARVRAGRPLTPRQREWCVEMLRILDARRKAGDVEDLDDPWS